MNTATVGNKRREHASPQASSLEAHAFRTDAHGRFELNGQAPLPAVDLEVETAGYPTRVFPGCRAGARDLNLVLGPQNSTR